MKINGKSKGRRHAPTQKVPHKTGHAAEHIWPVSVYIAIRAASNERKSDVNKAVRASMQTDDQAETKLNYSEYK